MLKVSVPIQCYSHDKFFEQALQSALDQTYPNLEIVVFDNGCNEDYRRQIEQIVAKHPSVSLIRADKNMFGHSFRSQCITRLTGDFIAILFDDDIWEKDRLEKCVAAMERDKSDFLFHGRTFIDETGAEHYGDVEAFNKDPLYGDEDYGGLIAEFIKPPYGTRITYPNMFLRMGPGRAALMRHNFQSRISDAFFVAGLLLDKSLKGTILPDKLTRHRIHGGNDASYRKFRMASRREEVAKDFFAQIELFRFVMSKGDDADMIAFLKAACDLKPTGDYVTDIVIASVLLCQIQLKSRLPTTSPYFATILYHEALERDYQKAWQLIEALTQTDPNSFMEKAYTQTIKALQYLVGAGSNVPVSIWMHASIEQGEGYARRNEDARRQAAGWSP